MKRDLALLTAAMGLMVCFAIVVLTGQPQPGVGEWTAARITGSSATATALQITSTTFGNGLTIGGDTDLYRSAANTLATDGGLVVTGTLVPNGAVTLGSSYFMHCVAKTTTYTSLGTDQCIDVTSGTWTLTIHSAVGSANQVLTITNKGSGVITLNTTSAQTISGQASGVITLAQYDSITVKSDNANWFIQ